MSIKKDSVKDVSHNTLLTQFGGNAKFSEFVSKLFVSMGFANSEPSDEDVNVGIRMLECENLSLDKDLLQ